jgi:hypothetical protein
MLICMRTTLIIPDALMNRLREKAAKENSTISEMVESAIRLWLQPERQPQKLPPLPTYRGGGFLVDVANREALYSAMESED